MGEIVSLFLFPALGEVILWLGITAVLVWNDSRRSPMFGSPASAPALSLLGIGVLISPVWLLPLRDLPQALEMPMPPVLVYAVAFPVFHLLSLPFAAAILGGTGYKRLSSRARRIWWFVALGSAAWLLTIAVPASGAPIFLSGLIAISSAVCFVPEMVADLGSARRESHLTAEPPPR